ncbi:hypothetical protein [Demequina sediminicola]|uniref:hypothetical protein n=1 Tax=Demequina sediminicola TaxID=1095026 RepID=UPI000785304E|nr:hypothetical protein [Demequina sediminicola]
MSDVLTARARIASLSRSRAADDPDYVAARTDLAAAKLEQYVSKVLADAPPLTDGQRERVAALLRPHAGGGSDD